ncbi:MAG: TrkA family potassium uptake protein [Oscillospiraceae bacterium]|nr:TrkA family potassium uptake protein [Oscillospiraceae bacterium]
MVIVGGGKVGYYLAKTLLEHDHNPVIVEINKFICHKLADELDIPVISGDGTTIQMLELAKLGEADILASVTGKDEDNLIACQLAQKRFGIERTVARVNNPKNIRIMKELGVDAPVSSTDNIARLIERELNTNVITQLLSLNGGEVSLIEFNVPSNFEFDGTTLTEFKMPSEAVIVAVYHAGELVIPRGNTKLFVGDRVVILIKDEMINELYETFSLKEEDI